MTQKQIEKEVIKELNKTFLINIDDAVKETIKLTQQKTAQSIFDDLQNQTFNSYEGNRKYYEMSEEDWDKLKKKWSVK